MQILYESGNNFALECFPFYNCKFYIFVHFCSSRNFFTILLQDKIISKLLFSSISSGVPLALLFLTLEKIYNYKIIGKYVLNNTIQPNFLIKL